MEALLPSGKEALPSQGRIETVGKTSRRASGEYFHILCQIFGLFVSFYIICIERSTGTIPRCFLYTLSEKEMSILIDSGQSTQKVSP